jgi:hypothetical protein
MDEIVGDGNSKLTGDAGRGLGNETPNKGIAAKNAKVRKTGSLNVDK